MLKKDHVISVGQILIICLLFCFQSLYSADGDNNFRLIFTNSLTDSIDSNTRDVAAGSDLDQDGKYEVIVTDYENGGKVHVFECTGNNTYEWVWSSPGTPSLGTFPTREVKTGDMDNDGLGEILMPVSRDDTPDSSYGIYVYEWDGINDNGYIFRAIIPIDYQLASGFTEDFYVGDIDDDNSTELVFLNAGNSADDKVYIISVTGTFENQWTQNTEAVFSRSNGDFDTGPYDVVVADLDGDGFKEVIVGTIEDFGGLFIAEVTAPDTYVPQIYLHSSTIHNVYYLEGMAAADFDNDDADELFLCMYPINKLAVLKSGNDVSKISRSGNVRILRDNIAELGVAIGDQDHGAGSDGLDIYITYYGSDTEPGCIQDLEFTGTDVLLASSYTEYIIFEENNNIRPGGLFQVDAPTVDLDGDGKKELLLSYTGETANGTYLRIFEFSDPDVNCQRGDVNMDGNISPGDALCAFQIYLNDGVPPAGECDTDCSLEAADCDCTPNGITPGDALYIFMGYLNNETPPLDCNPTVGLAKTNPEHSIQLIQNSAESAEEVAISLAVKNPVGLNAIGLDVGFSDDKLEFVKIQATNLIAKWECFAAKEILPGVVRIGGFNDEPIGSKDIQIIANLIFRIKESNISKTDIWTFNPTDNFRGNGETKITIELNAENSHSMFFAENYQVHQNYPNPFNQETVIEFFLKRPARVSIKIYDIEGHLIQNLVQQNWQAGIHRIIWDGKDSKEKNVGSGVYFCIFTAHNNDGNFTRTLKMTLLK